MGIADTSLDDDEQWMRRALACASKAEEHGEVPVGAIVVLEGECIAEAWNAPIGSCDPSAHAEIAALRKAAKVCGNYRLVNATLYVTLEPCMMCVGAMTHARIARLVYAASEPKAGVIESQLQYSDLEFLNHRFSIVGGVLADESRALLRSFFRRRRER